MRSIVLLLLSAMLLGSNTLWVLFSRLLRRSFGVSSHVAYAIEWSGPAIFPSSCLTAMAILYGEMLRTGGPRYRVDATIDP